MANVRSVLHLRAQVNLICKGFAGIEAIEVLVTHIDFAIQKTQNINQISSTKSLKYLTDDENGYSNINLLLSLLEFFSKIEKKNCLNKPFK